MHFYSRISTWISKIIKYCISLPSIAIYLYNRGLLILCRLLSISLKLHQESSYSVYVAGLYDVCTEVVASYGKKLQVYLYLFWEKARGDGGKKEPWILTAK